MKSPLRSPALIALTLPILWWCEGCTDSTEERTAVRPPLILDDAMIRRFIATAEGLRDVSRTHPDVLRQGREFLPVSQGITAVLGASVTPVLERNGFRSAEEFESVLGNVQLVLKSLLLGEHGGFDGAAQRYRMNIAIQDYETELKDVLADATLSEDERRLRKYELETKIESVRDRIGETEDVADAMKSQHDGIPPENVEVVKDHLEALMALVMPELPLPVQNG